MKLWWTGALVLTAGWLAGAEALAVADADAALAAAQARLTELRRTCQEGHPLVQAELRRIAELEQQRRLAGDPQAALKLARERLVELRRTCRDHHPAVQAQLRLIAELAQKPAAPVRQP